jgi:hypothetical protein
LSKKDIKINYFLLDKAVVFNNEKHVKLKYGERNFGNFHIHVSNYAKKKSLHQDHYTYVELKVETISVKEIMGIVDNNKSSDAMIIKIDCKNQTTRLFLDMLDQLQDYTSPYLVACEKDSSSQEDVSNYDKPNLNVLTKSNVFPEIIKSVDSGD